MNAGLTNAIVKEQRLGIASDHGGFELKQYLFIKLNEEGYGVKDFGNNIYDADDDYPDYVLPLALALNRGEIDRAIAICGSGVGACVAANKISGVRACLIHETFSARQAVEDDNLNMICLGGRVIGNAYALELITIFLSSSFSNAKRHLRRLEKVKTIENFSGNNPLK